MLNFAKHFPVYVSKRLSTAVDFV